MNTDQTSTIDETVIEALRAQTRRYDVAIDDELVLSVLPNGVKTWTWVYDDPFDSHRKTLGIYPAMSLEDARKSLADEKRADRTGGPGREFVVRDGRIESAHPAPQAPIIIGAVIALIAVAVLAYFAIGGNDDSQFSQTESDQSSPFADQQTETILQLPTTAELLPELPSGTVTELPNVLPTDLAADQTGTFTANGAVEQSAELAVANTSDTEAAESADVTIETAAITDSSASPETEAPVTGLDRQFNVPSPAPPAVTVAVTTDADSVLITDSRVTRAVLTTAVNAREPVDDLGSTIIGNGEALQTYYFFTELRRLNGQRARHRWLYRDQVVAEVPFDVGEAWRWRVYSSKSFYASMAGQWQVQVVLDDDTVIYSQPISFTP